MSLEYTFEEPKAIVLADEKNKLHTALAQYASALSNLTPEQVPAAMDMTTQLKKLATEVYDRLRERILAHTKANGQIVSEKGSMSNSVGGFKVSAIPTRTGIDPKKLESMLRSKGKDPSVAMNSTITYTVNMTKLLDSQLLSEADIAACHYDPAYRVMVERE